MWELLGFVAMAMLSVVVSVAANVISGAASENPGKVELTLLRLAALAIPKAEREGQIEEWRQNHRVLYLDRPNTRFVAAALLLLRHLIGICFGSILIGKRALGQRLIGVLRPTVADDHLHCVPTMSVLISDREAGIHWKVRVTQTELELLKTRHRIAGRQLRDDVEVVVELSKILERSSNKPSGLSRNEASQAWNDLFSSDTD